MINDYCVPRNNTYTYFFNDQISLSLLQHARYDFSMSTTQEIQSTLEFICLGLFTYREPNITCEFSQYKAYRTSPETNAINVDHK